MAADEVLPGCGLTPLRGGSNPMAAQDVADRLVGQLMPQVGQGSDNAVVTPAGVLSRQTLPVFFPLTFLSHIKGLSAQLLTQSRSA